MNMKSMFGKKTDLQHSHSAEELDRAGERAKMTAKKLEAAEEEFKAELMAKNEEMTAMSAALHDVQEQLLNEKRTQTILDDQIETAQHEIRKRDKEASALKGRVTDLEGDLADLHTRFQTVVREGKGEEDGGGGGRNVTMDRGGSSAVFHTWWLRDQEVEALSRKTAEAEHRAEQLAAAAAALRSLVLAHGAAHPSLPPTSPDDDKPSVWEAAALQDQELLKELAKEMKGKDELIKELQTLLEQRK